MNRLNKGLMVLAVTITTLLLLSFGISFAETLSYTYDDLNRLIRIDYEDGRAVEYVYDEIGNRLQRSGMPPDTTPPTGSIQINSGASYTNNTTVTLTPSCSDNRACSQMQFSNDNGSWSAAETYSTTKQWTLAAGDGTKTVFVKYKDKVGNWSTGYSASIVLDTIPPVDGTLTATPGAGQVALNWSGFTDNLSGINRYILVYNPNTIPSSCSATACPSGMTYSAQYNVCLQTATPVCTAGTTWNALTAKCEQNPTCPTGGSYNPVTDRCETAVSNTYQCSYSGTIYSTAAACTSGCVQTAACTSSTVCTTCSWSDNNGTSGSTSPGSSLRLQCRYDFDANCVATVWVGNDSDGWNQNLASPCYPGNYSNSMTPCGQNTSSCGVNYTCPISGGSACDGAHNCSKSYSCSTNNNCPSGYSWNGSVCVANATCSVGSLNTANDTCQSNPTNYSCSQGTYDGTLGQCKANSAGTELYTGASTSYSHTNTTGTTHNYRLCSVDNAENTSAGATASTVNLFTVTASSGDNGTITCNSPVNYGDNSTCTLTPNSGYQVQTLTDNTADVTASVTGNMYRITNVTANHTVTAVFADTTAPTGSITINGGAAYTNNSVVTLTLSCADGNNCSQMQFSHDNLTWSQAESYMTTKQWSLASGDGAKTVYVTYSDTAGNWSSVFNASIILDITASTGSIIINGGASYVNSSVVTLTLLCADSNNCTQTQFSNDNTTWSSAEAYAVSKQWTLTAGDGSKTVFVKYKDAAGNWSMIYVANIILDTTAPTGSLVINGGAANTNNSVVTLTPSCTDSTGCSQMQFSNDNTTWASAETYTTSKQWTVTTGDGSKTVFAKYKDTAGNWSIVYSSGIVLNTTAPSGSFVINGGGAYTNNTSVTLTLSCTDCSQMQFSNDNGSWSVAETYSTTKQWTLTTGDGTKTVFVKYKNVAGNWSAAYSANIVLDTTTPVDGTITATPTAVGQITLNWSAFADNVSGINRYIIVYNPNSVPANCSATACPSGMTYSAQYNACLQAATPVCTAGTTWNVTTAKCEQSPTCTPGGSYNPATDRCETAVSNTYQCSYSSTIYSTSTACTSGCVQSAACTASTVCSSCSAIDGTGGGTTTTSPGGSFVSGVCRWNFDAVCNATVYNGVGSEGGESPNLGNPCAPGGGSWTPTPCGTNASSCSLNYSCPIGGGSACDGAHNCSKSYSCNTLNNCPSGYTWNGSICVTTAACSVGSLNTANDTCQSNPTSYSCSQGTYDGTLGQCKANPVATPIYTGASTSYIHTNTTGTTHNYRVCAVDNAENTSLGATASTVTSFTITASSSGNGTITCNSPVNYGDNSTCTLTPNAGYNLQTLTDNTVDVTASVTGNIYKIANVNANHTITVAYADTTAPTGSIVISGGVDTKTTAVTLTLSCTDNIACSQMQLSNDNETWTTYAYATTKQWTLTTGDGTKTVFVKYKDAAGNWSTVYSDSIILDTTAPTGSIIINGGAVYTKTTAVTLTLSCSDSNNCAQMRFSNDNATWSANNPYVTTKPWTLAAGNGTKKVYAKYKDAAGNWSIVYYSSIFLDVTAPSTSALPAGGTYSSAQTVTLSCSDTGGSGCDKIYYTTDNTTPTTTSAVYAAPINISSTTTLKYFATDQAGNSGIVNSQTYTINGQ